MKDVVAVLGERGFIEQATDEAALHRLFSEERVQAYIGFDPSASSLHVGSLVPIMGLVHVQRCGHRPIAVAGGGTGRVGDPSGKTEMRRVLAEAEIETNLEGLRAQLSHYLDLVAPDEDGAAERGLIIDNSDWLLALNYVEFLRDIGRHFSVNRMLAAESVKQRIESESGLSFLEFNYMILQAYDFLVLNQRHACKVQMGGSDQWGNIVAGIDLIRRVESRPAYGITFPLVTTSSGHKMGKTEKGAVWLDPTRTSPYDYYQFWINTDDRDVGRFLRLFTLLEIDAIEELERLEGKDIRRAKEVLAFEAASLTHGQEEAEKARSAAQQLFGDGPSASDDSVPTYGVAKSELDEGIPVVRLFADCGLCSSRGEARRMAKQNGLYINGETVSHEYVVSGADLRDGSILLRAGKKKYTRVVAGQ